LKGMGKKKRNKKQWNLLPDGRITEKQNWLYKIKHDRRRQGHYQE